jgi:hypothetical protein
MHHTARELKFCVFCGGEPRHKTVEHIIPQWLIEITGDPKREAWFGPYWNTEKGQFENLKIPFDQFKFPSCSECNSKYSQLEGIAKAIITSILEERALSNSDLSILFTWLDKIRIGLWLGIYYLHRDVSDIDPHMFIDSRLDLSDRLVFIYKSDFPIERINIPGTNTYAFQILPCCFTLLINNIAFFNMATDFLFSRRIGLPYPEDMKWENWPTIEFALVKGSERIRLPLIRKSYNVRCTQLFQPMFRPNIVSQFPELYETEYVREVFQDHKNGIGKVFICTEGGIEEYPSDPSDLWIPSYTWKGDELEEVVSVQTLEFQLYLQDIGPGHKGLDSVREGIIKQQYQLSRDLNHSIIKSILKAN